MLGVCLQWEPFTVTQGGPEGGRALRGEGGLAASPSALPCAFLPLPGLRDHHLWDQVMGYFYWLHRWPSISPITVQLRFSFCKSTRQQDWRRTDPR